MRRRIKMQLRFIQSPIKTVTEPRRSRIDLELWIFPNLRQICFANCLPTASKSARNAMKFRIKVLSALTWMTPATLFAAEFVYQPVALAPPLPLREFRGAWIAVVASNQDWPSQPGLPAAQ